MMNPFIMRLSVCGWFLILCLTSGPAQVTISEFLASNEAGVFVDDDGEATDWIEIHNEGNEAVNLAGYGLTDAKERVKFTFPEAMLEPGGYLVVFASGKDRSEPGAALHTSFQLDRSGEYLALMNPGGETLRSFDPEYPGQSADVSYGLADSSMDAYAFFPVPTPGEPNQTPPPLIVSTDFSPKPVVAEEPLIVTASVEATAAEIATVILRSRVMYRNETTTMMKDDGEAPDAQANDGIYTARISNTSLFGPVFKPGEMVRWAIEVEDVNGTAARWPAFANETDEEYTGSLIEPGDIDTQLDVFHWFVEEPRRAESNGGTRSACYYNGEFYDNLFTRVRGGTARGWPKKSFKVEFPDDHHLKFDPDLPRVDEFNLNATYTDKSYTRAILTTELHQASGHPSPITFPLRVHQNGAFYSVALFVEQPDRDFLRRNDLDPDGAYYKGGPGSTYTSTGPFEKKTRRDEGKEDLSALIDGLRLSGNELQSFVFDNVNIPAQVNFMAGIAITQNIDGSDKNHYLFRDTEGTGEWYMTPWDLDLSFGPDALNTDVIVANEERRGGIYPNATHPFIGSHKFPLHAGKTNELIDAIVVGGRTEEMLLRRIRTLHDQFLATDYFDKRLDELVALFAKDADLDNETWGAQSHFGGRRDSMEETVQRIKDEYLIDRRDFFERGGGVGIPASMPDQVAMEISEIEFSPSSGNQREEYLRLTNPNRFAVDLSGWQLEGAVEHTFAPGTVMGTSSLFSPGRNILYVVKETRAFRARAEGPAAGNRLFIQGNYRGSLSSRGEEIRLLDAEGNLIVSEAYEGAPTDWQKHLVITEILADPGADYAEFIELQNTGDTSLDLTGVRFTRGVQFEFTQTIGPGEILLVVRDRAAFEATYGTGFPIAGTFAEGTRLDNNGETLKLEDPSNNTIAEFRYAGDPTWPEAKEAFSYTYQSGDHEEGGSWRLSAMAGGDPDQVNDVGGEVPTVIEQVFGTADPRGEVVKTSQGLTLSYPITDVGERTLVLEHSSDLQSWTETGVEPDFSEAKLVSFEAIALENEGFVRVRIK